MKNMFIEAVLGEQKRIQRFIDLSASRQGEERGSLHLQKHGQQVYGYERWRKKGEPDRSEYLGNLESEPVRELFTVKYLEQRLVRLQHDQRLLEKVVKKYQPYDFRSVVEGMSRAYQRVARDGSFEERYEELRAWAEADYPKNPHPFPDSENYAKDGTRLRSKGECIWYNMLQERGVLFRYDCEIEIVDLNGNVRKFYPDFLIQCFDGSFVVIEHLGKMGDIGYAVDFGEKSHWYFREGFILGKNYFVTSDDRHYGTDSQMIARYVDRVEELFFAS